MTFPENPMSTEAPPAIEPIATLKVLPETVNVPCPMFGFGGLAMNRPGGRLAMRVTPVAVAVPEFMTLKMTPAPPLGPPEVKPWNEVETRDVSARSIGGAGSSRENSEVLPDGSVAVVLIRW